MQPRHSRLLVAILGAITELHPAASFATPSEKVAEIIAAQLHRQGVACTTPRDAVPNLENSTALETVWTLRCDEATYRVTLIPHMRAHITPQEDRCENSIGKN